jgi:hypothetical protein
LPFEAATSDASKGSRPADREQLRCTSKEDRHLVAERLSQPGFDPGRQPSLVTLLGAEDHVAAGPKAGDIGEAQRLELLPQLLVLDPATAEVHPTQEGDVALHSHHHMSPGPGNADKWPDEKALRWRR